MNSSGDLQWSGLHCSKDALTDVFGWFLQGLLAGLAFTCLIGELAISKQHYIGGPLSADEPPFVTTLDDPVARIDWPLLIGL